MFARYSFSGVLSLAVCAFALFAGKYISPAEPYGLTGFIILCFVTLLTFGVIIRQPMADVDIAFKVGIKYFLNINVISLNEFCRFH